MRIELEKRYLEDMNEDLGIKYIHYMLDKYTKPTDEELKAVAKFIEWVVAENIKDIYTPRGKAGKSYKDWEDEARKNGTLDS